VRVSADLAGFVIMLVAFEVQQIELVHHAQALEHVEIAVNRDLINAGVHLLGFFEKLLGVQMRLGRFEDREDQAALPGQTQAVLLGERREAAPAADFSSR